MMTKKRKEDNVKKRWYNPKFFKTKFLLLCFSLCFLSFIIWLENRVPDLTALPGIWRSENGQVMAISGKRESVSDLDYTLYDGSLSVDGHTLAKQEKAVFTKLENSILLVKFGSAQIIMLSDTKLFYRGETFYKDRFYFQKHYDFGAVVTPVGEPFHLGRVMDFLVQGIYSSLAVATIYWLLQSMFPLFSVSILIPRAIRQKWAGWRKKKEEQDKKKAPKPIAPTPNGTFRLFLQTLYAIGAKIWWFLVGCFTVLVVIGGIYGVAGAFIPGLIVNSDDLPGLWKTNDGIVLAISTIHDDRGRGTTQYDWEVVRDGVMLLDWGDVYSDDREDGYASVISLGDGKTPEQVFYMKGADQMVFDGETYHKVDTEEETYNFGNMVARVGFDDQTSPRIWPGIFISIMIVTVIWLAYDSKRPTKRNQATNSNRKEKKTSKKRNKN